MLSTKYKNYKLISILLVVVLLFSNIAVGEISFDKSKISSRIGKDDTERWIVPHISSDNAQTLSAKTANYKSLGCKIMHELRDATAIKCPKGLKIENAEVDEVYHLLDIQADAQIGADKVWALGYNGSGVTVAVLDTGIDTDHPDLVDSIIGGMDFGSFGTYEDDNGHGTHVSGIITANGIDVNAKGVAPGAKIWVAKVCDKDGRCYSSDIQSAIEYVVDNKIAGIMSMSFGATLSLNDSECEELSETARKVNWAVENGVTVVAAAGNDGDIGAIANPACAAGAIAVGSVTKDDIRSGSSSTGSALDIVAPGASIYSTYLRGGYASLSGTSMATPHVSAVVALLKQAKPGITEDEIKTVLYTTAKDLGDEGWDKFYGWGRVDAFKAVASLLPPSHDVAVTEIITPSFVTKGSQAKINVTVTNQGTFGESFTVTLTDETDQFVIGSKSVSLDEFSSQSLTFNWNTSSSSIGAHTLKAEASAVPEETDTEDNIKAAVVEVKELPKMHIKSIDMSLGADRRTRKIFGKAVVTIADAENKAVSKAVVSGKWSGATSDKDSGVTSAQGKVLVTSNKVKAKRGLTFTFCVDNIVKDGYIYDSASDAEKCDSVRNAIV